MKYETNCLLSRFMLSDKSVIVAFECLNEDILSSFVLKFIAQLV
jgi:hypothetical protein